MNNVNWVLDHNKVHILPNYNASDFASFFGVANDLNFLTGHSYSRSHHFWRKVEAGQSSALLTHEWRRNLRRVKSWPLLVLTHSAGVRDGDQLRTLGITRRHHRRSNIATAHLVALLCYNMYQKQMHSLNLLISKAYERVV